MASSSVNKHLAYYVTLPTSLDLSAGKARRSIGYMAAAAFNFPKRNSWNFCRSALLYWPGAKAGDICKFGPS